MSGLADLQGATKKTEDPIVFAAAERARKAAAGSLSTIMTDEGEFDHVIGQHTRELTQKPSGVIREYVPKKPKQWPIWNKPGEEFQSEMDDVRRNPHGRWGEKI